jgi:hypothetical protein
MMGMVTFVLLFLFTLVVLTGISRADDINLHYGVDPFRSRDSKIFSLSHISPLFDPIPTKTELGLFTDRLNSSSGYLFQSVGIRVNPGPILAESFWGVGLISSPDNILSTHLQFTNDLNLGIVDKSGNSIGVSYKHISNAGIKSPNVGRDFLMVYWKFKIL